MMKFISYIYITILLFFAFSANGQPPVTIPIGTPVEIPTLNPTGTDPAVGTTPNKKLELDAAQKEALEQEQEKENKKNKEEEQQKIKFDLRQSELPEAKIWGQQFFRDQSVSLFTRSRDIKALDDYTLNTGDELNITIWGAVNYSVNAKIKNNGSIELTNPLYGTDIPKIYVKGLKLGEAKKAIIKRLREHMNIRNSQYAIELNYTRNITVNITGEVFHPGSYTIPATNTAFNALVASGGPSQIGSVRNIQVISSNKETKTLDVYKFMNDPKLLLSEFFLDKNDYIYVPLAQKVVEIQGAVSRPFFYELKEGEELNKLLHYAGGLKADAYTKNIQIIRYTNNEERIIDVNLQQLQNQFQDFILKNGDIISISTIKQAYSNYIEVEGAVQLPGTYELKKDIRIRDVLQKAGIVRSAVMNNVYVKRLKEDLSLEYIKINIFDILDNPNSPSNIYLAPFDIIEVKYKSEFIDKHQISVFGAVRKPGEYLYSKNLKLADLIYLSNGIKPEAKNSYIEIARLEQNSSSDSTYITIKKIDIKFNGDTLILKGANSFKLLPHDQIFVRTSKNYQLPQNISIKGEILRPGLYTLSNKGERISDIIARAGEYTDYAFLEGATMTRPEDGEIILNLRDVISNPDNSRFNYILKGGDRIFIPRMKNFVSITGKINHPKIKSKEEIAEMKLDLELQKATTDLERKEILLEEQKNKAQQPLKINVPFHTNKRAIFYIKQYGAGIDYRSGGRRSRVFVKYPNGQIKKAKNFLFFRIYPKVSKGALVLVDSKPKKIKKYTKRKPLDLYKTVTNTFAILTSGLTIYALLKASLN